MKRTLPLPEFKRHVTIAEFAATTTWNQFHAHCTEKEFYQHAWLARDNYFAETSGFSRLDTPTEE